MNKNLVSKFTGMSSLDKIRYSFEDETFPLSEADQAIKLRYKRASSLLLNMYSPAQAVKMLMDEFGVSQATAYRDVKNSSVILGSVAEIDVKGARIQLREAYWMLYQKCLKENNHEGARKNLDSYQTLLNSDIDQLFDPESLEAHDYVMEMPKEMEVLLKDVIASGKPTVLNYDPEDVHDVDFKEIYPDTNEINEEDQES